MLYNIQIVRTILYSTKKTIPRNGYEAALNLTKCVFISCGTRQLEKKGRFIQKNSVI